jgi:hypothetical protein
MDERQITAEETLRLLARALAPYLADELRRLDTLGQEALNPNYDQRTCVRFVDGLGHQVLVRMIVLFELLQRERVVDSVRLANELGTTPRALSGYLTTPLKRRAKALDLPPPFAGGQGTELYGGIPSPSPDMDPERTHWEDREGIAARMLEAIRSVQHGPHASGRAEQEESRT